MYYMISYKRQDINSRILCYHKKGGMNHKISLYCFRLLFHDMRISKGFIALLDIVGKEELSLVCLSAAAF